ncbi:MAG: leucyl aminopeptidase family protein, partial [Gammaproteobacteria bacterium]|nr:leucyl aminopeptidase family protein [Gammaproteobacteria bacterium]
MNLPASLLLSAETGATPIIVTTSAALDTVKAGLPDAARGWIDANGFNAKPGSWLAVPG